MQEANNTKIKILIAAEQVFAENGYSGASVRAITRKANVNSALVNYHFRSKDALFKAVVCRRAMQIHEELREEIKKAKNSFPTNRDGSRWRIKDLLSVIQRILIEHDRQGRSPLFFMWHVLEARTRLDSPIRKTYLSESTSLLAFLHDEFRQTLRHLPEETVAWRFQFMLGSLEKIIAPVCVAEDVILSSSSMDTESAIEELSVLIDSA